jgi:hypothetical protein
MQKSALDTEVVAETLGCIFKYQEDIKRFKDDIWSDPDQRAAYLT